MKAKRNGRPLNMSNSLQLRYCDATLYVRVHVNTQFLIGVSSVKLIMTGEKLRITQDRWSQCTYCPIISYRWTKTVTEFALQWPTICKCCAVVRCCNFPNITGVSGGFTEEGLDMQLYCQWSIDLKMMHSPCAFILDLTRVTVILYLSLLLSSKIFPF